MIIIDDDDAYVECIYPKCNAYKQEIASLVYQIE